MCRVLNSDVLQFGEMFTNVSKDLPASLVSLENRGSLLLQNVGINFTASQQRRHNF